MSSKKTLLAMSIAYLALTLYLFLSSSGIEIVLLFAIFSYIFYTPLTVIFKYDIDDVESGELAEYIMMIAYILVGFIVLYSSGIFSAEAFVKIMKFIASNMPKLEFPDIMPFIKSLSWWYILVLIGIIIVLNVLFLYVLAAAVALYLLVFLFNMLLGVIIIILYLAVSIGILTGLFFIAYKGHKITKKYVKNDFQRALIFFSTISSGIYLVLVFYINLFTLA